MGRCRTRAVFLPSPITGAGMRVVKGQQSPELVVATELEEAVGDGL